LDNAQIKVLNNIVEKNGDCLTAYLCNECPFRKKCLPEFLHENTRPSRKERYEMASDTLARISLLLDES
jgi:hypothetical protein